jgi:hypothetical protein
VPAAPAERRIQVKFETISIFAAGLLVSQLAWGGPYDAPYGKIEIGDRSVTRNQETAAISRIDGKSTKNPRRPDPVSPGKHSVEISFSSARTVVGDQLKTIEIDVEPCKRYRIVAHYDTPASGKWEPEIQSVEDIGECRKKFMKSAPAK